MSSTVVISRIGSIATVLLPCLLCGGLILRAQAPKAPAAAPTAIPTRVSTQVSTDDLAVGVGKSVLVDTAHPIQRVSIGLGDFAQASAVSPTEILLNGKAAGETSLIIWEVGGERQFFNVTVYANSTLSDERLDILRRELRTELPGQTIKVSTDNANVFLRGTVKDLGSADRAVQIASTLGKVVNLLYVEVPASDPQILLKVRFASVDRNLSKQFGINVFDSGFGNVIGTLTTGQFTSLSSSSGNTGTAVASGSSSPNLVAYLPGLDITATIQALESKGIVEVLSEPNVLAVNGKQASFLAGGEFPYPVVQGGSGGSGSSVSIMFKEYGVRLNFIPTITPRGTIRLQVAPEVSSLDFTNGVEISGFDVPSIDTRKVRTEVELRDGQSFVIGGLLDNRDNETYEKIPFLGDIPILGKFFQSMQKSRTNAELIVIVTPELVAPIPTGAPVPELNYTSKFMPPNSPIPMHTPDGKTAANTMAPAPATMPVEELIESMKPETPLNVDSAAGTFGAGSSGNAAAPSSSPAPVTTAAPQ